MISKINENIQTINVRIQSLDDKVIAIVNVNKINLQRIKQLEDINSKLIKQNNELGNRVKKLEKGIQNEK